MRRFILFATLIVIATTGLAQETETIQITMDEFLEIIKDEHPLLKRVEFGEQIIEAEREGLTGQEEWNISANGGVNRYSVTGTQQSSGMENSTTFSLGGGASRLFWNTGGMISGDVTLSGLALGYADDPIYSSFDKSAWDNSIYVTYVQPLMKNFKGVLNRLPYEMKQIEIEQEKLEVTETVESFMAENATYFIEWVYYLAVSDILDERLELAKESLAQNRNKYSRNIIDEVDVLRAESSVKSVELSISMNNASLKSLLKILETITGIEDLGSYIPVYDLYETHQIGSVDEVYSRFESESRTLGSLNQSIDLLEMTRNLNKENAKRDLSLTARAGIKDYDGDFSDAILMDKADLSVNLVYDFPVGNKSAEADIQRTELLIMELQAQIEETKLEFNATISSLMSQIADIEQIIEINRQQIELAKKQTKEELVLYERGQSDFSFVIQSRDSEENAKLALAQNALSYQKLYLQLLSIIDEFYEI